MPRTNQKLLDTLIEMHTYCRPMGSDTEKAFIARYISNLPNAEQDRHGNWHVTVDAAPVLWSCHTDTVHREQGRQMVKYRRKTGTLVLDTLSKSDCLGADDTAGVFLCREMILAKVPGHYVFHYGEERGGVGSRDLAKLDETFLRQFQFAIALDRQGTADIITHQGGERSASDAFALSLAAQLGGYYGPCGFGIYTDTDEYKWIIPECTNVSVGYQRAHSSKEILDCKHVVHLLEALKRIDSNKFVVGRDAVAEHKKYLSWLMDTQSKCVFDDERDYLSWEYVSDRWDDQDFIEAEKVTRRDSLLWDEWPDDDKIGTSIDCYLDPVFADVQKELRKQFLSRERKPH